MVGPLCGDLAPVGGRGVMLAQASGDGEPCPKDGQGDGRRHTKGQQRHQVLGLARSWGPASARGTEQKDPHGDPEGHCRSPVPIP